MSSKDIIKQILVKFKGDTTELKKSVADAQKVASNLNRGTSLNQQYGTMDKFIKNISKTNENLSKTFTIFQKGMKGVLEGDMQKFEKRAETQYKRIQILQRELDRASLAGDRARANRVQEVMGNANRRLNASMTGYNDASKTLASANENGFGSGFARGVSGALGIPMMGTPALIGLAAAAAAAKAVQLIANAPSQEISNIRQLTDISRGYFKSGTQGDLSNAYLMSTDPSAMQRAKNAAGTTGKLFDLNTYTNNPLKTFENSIKTVFTSAPWNYNATMKKYVEQDTAENFQNIKQSTMNPEKLAYLSSRAGSRLDFQRQFGLNDAQRLAYATVGRSTLMSEDEMMGASFSLRDKVGANTALGLATEAGKVRADKRIGIGMSLDKATSMMGSLSMISGGGKASSDQLIDIMAKAFSRGIDDAALAEKITAASIGMMEKAGVTGSANKNALDISTLATMISPNGQANARTVGAAINVNDKLGRAFSAGGEDEMYRIQVLNKLANKTNNPAAALLLLSKMGGDPQKMQNLGENELFQSLMPKRSIEEINKMGSEALFQSVQGPMAMRQHDPNAAFLREWRKSKNYQKALAAAAVETTAFGAESSGSSADQMAYAGKLLAATGNEEIQKAIITNMTGSDKKQFMFGKQTEANGGVSGQMGQNLIKQEQIQDSSSYRDINTKDVSKAAALSQQQTKMGLSSGIDGSIDGVIQALDNLKGSLKEIGNSSTSRAGK
jgi:hypothetical protein